MPVTGKITLYSFDELNETARARVRDWYKQRMIPADWDVPIIQDAAHCGDCMGIEIDDIHYDGLLTKKGGVAFEGTYTYSQDAHRAVRKVAPNDKNLHAIADALQSIETLYWASTHTASPGQLSARVEVTKSEEGHAEPEIYVDLTDEKRVSIDEVQTGHGYAEPDVATVRGITALMKMFMNWIYQDLCEGYRRELSDEYIGETVTEDGYLFTEDGFPLDGRNLMQALEEGNNPG